MKKKNKDRLPKSSLDKDILPKSQTYTSTLDYTYVQFSF